MSKIQHILASFQNFSASNRNERKNEVKYQIGNKVLFPNFLSHLWLTLKGEIWKTPWPCYHVLVRRQGNLLIHKYVLNFKDITIMSQIMPWEIKQCTRVFIFMIWMMTFQCHTNLNWLVNKVFTFFTLDLQRTKVITTPT